MSRKAARDTLNHYINGAYLDAIRQTLIIPEPSTGYGLLDYDFLKEVSVRQKLVNNFMQGIQAKHKDIDGLLKTYLPGTSFEQFAQEAESELSHDVEEYKHNFKFELFDVYRNRILRSTFENLEKKVRRR
jgi:hypothetical protein